MVIAGGNSPGLGLQPCLCLATPGGRRSSGCPCDTRCAPESLSRQQGPPSFPDEDAFSILPQIKPWLLQHLPQSSVCITSYWGRAVWELLLLPGCSCQQRDYPNPLSWGVNLLYVQLLPLCHGIDPQAKSVTHKEILFHLPNNGLNIQYSVYFIFFPSASTR